MERIPPPLRCMGKSAQRIDPKRVAQRPWRKRVCIAGGRLDAPLLTKVNGRGGGSGVQNSREMIAHSIRFVK
jgi:hypothetical protein